ncbi:MAG TPA: hypothetical protein VFL54_09115 [Gammaproteobacteria bacterium]|nr:hypothetical protein [Gammaproteobacteria bacterium]
MNQCTEEQFLKDVADHEMQVIQDDGLYRHVRFREGDSPIMGFDLITWPGHLCYTGDMGTYVFSRIPDMFQFFRAPEGRSGLYVNHGYWSEKLDAADKSDGFREYSPDKAKEVILQWLDDGKATASERREVEQDVLSRIHDGERAFRAAVDEFNHGEILFHDFWECNLQEYTYRFQWCCFALVWGIRQYDDASKVDVKDVAHA